MARDAEGVRQVPGQVPSSWRGASEETFIAEDQRFAAWLRAHIQPCYDTSVLSLAETAGQIVAWVWQSLIDAGTEPKPAS